MIWPLTLLLGLLVVLAITAATAYFVAQEFAYMSVDRSSLKAAATAGDAGARRALDITRRTSFMLSGAQLGITVTGLLVGYVAEPLIGSAVGEALGGVSVPQAVGVTIGTVAALVFATFVQMLLGELVPKNLSIARPTPVAVALSTSTRIYLAVFGWLITIFDKSSNLLLRLLRIEPVHDVEYSASRRDLERVVAASAKSGDLSPELSVLLDRIIDFPERTVEHAMIPRSRTGSVSPDAPIGAIRELMHTEHSRYPVLSDDDEVVGVVHLVDLLSLSASDTRDGRPLTAADVMRPPVFVPAAMRLPDAVAHLAAGDRQLACVIDEYGGFTGVLAVEDVAEELVGEIADEHDVAESPIRQDADGAWVVRGDLPIDELERIIEQDVPDAQAEDAETVAGLALAQHGAFLQVGDTVEIALEVDPAAYAQDDTPAPPHLQITVLEVARLVPSVVRLTVRPPADPADPTGDPSEEHLTLGAEPVADLAIRTGDER
ncbi:HlyC/CorC family transporter [Nakamurella flava]|uniref:HlyC/CorC family transporter n=1 Tax=Nakamurella flava TaxID=2576308 RepID=A0A4U6QEG6_9ACTN|nr:hemolysin family protein [Nakamurella flava]TKV58637.1 HlyC/CorC family transporter [Nakamurella flava]